jgi:hypothetical protein
VFGYQVSSGKYLCSARGVLFQTKLGAQLIEEFFPLGLGRWDCILYHPDLVFCFWPYNLYIGYYPLRGHYSLAAVKSSPEDNHPLRGVQPPMAV